MDAAESSSGGMLTTVVDVQLPAVLIADDVAAAKRYIEASTSPATRRAYESDWAIYETWCVGRSLASLPSPPAQVAMFLAAEAEAGKATSTLSRRLAAIGYVHRRASLTPPTAAEGAAVIEETMRGIRRTLGSAPRRKLAATADLVRAMIDAIPETEMRNLRDRALLAFGLASAMRRSELVAMRVEHLTWKTDGVEVTIPRSKADQEGSGATIAVPRGLRLRPVATLEAWMVAAGIQDGPVFRRLRRGGVVAPDGISGETVADILKVRAAAVGLDAAAFGAHSLRAGFLTSAASSGANIFKMKDQSRHAGLDMLGVYVRAADLFKDHAGAGFL